MAHWNDYHWLTWEPGPPSLTAERLSATSLRWKADGDGQGHWFLHWNSDWSYTGRLRYRFGADEVAAAGVESAWVTMSNLRPGGEYVLWVAGQRGAFFGQPQFVAVSLGATDTVLAAVKRSFAASPAATRALPGGLWTNEVPEEAELPYGYVELRGSKYWWTKEDFHVELAAVCVHVYAAGAEACEAATRGVRLAFDWQEVLFADGGEDSSSVQMQPTDYAVQSEFAKLGDGTVVYQGSVEYELMINRDVVAG